MSIIDPRTGNPLTAEPAPNTHTPTDSERPTVTREEVIIELNAGNIQQVLEASMQVPVLLDCWAPWCEPCKNLMPVLEKLAVEYGGAFLLATLDVEANPEIAGQLGVRSVPDVKLVSQGGLVDSFQGALPEKEVREWLNRYFPAAQPRRAGGRSLERWRCRRRAGDLPNADWPIPGTLRLPNWPCQSAGGGRAW